MSGEAVLLDSVILIDHFNGLPEATDYLRRVAHLGAISAITMAEVLVGFDELSAPGALRLLERFQLVEIDATVARRAALLRRARRWKLPDALQAAAALEHGLKLATRNTKDFDPTRDPFVVVPYEL
jgi:predicted nucleic acid-binding protein